MSFWIYLIALIVCLVLAIFCLSLYPISMKKMRNYKQAQMIEYKKNHPKSKLTDYNATGMYVPSSLRALYNAPLILSIVFFIVAFWFLIKLIS
ncbi:hypothetical protein HUN03_00177 [Mycoplasmopsis anatis]|uniref:hypothetical protein n=1 Tax=Mycoplasmopsis anatis TaxID=171279 RepID=UPI001C4DE531|nr:hypothetical protein [Mycoplasmopsis anatis]MBW0594581.1 hypothetical protein [Mycoplasmopsis anatis]MBW0595365.1 hypothetical protein [Mycoplasmopsis anatis]MBW0596268.1 hypothetical protein [Mycoplasmopsis anatis]MBW0597008.1 hypothetical protein [Mycoplasmopsis anatis]MBW0597300.1 hypothetical protein [Mycoplasmopsis anatis]